MAAESLLRSVWQENAHGLHCLSQARHAFRLAADCIAARGGGSPVLWFPDFFCEEALPAVRARDVKIAFYPLQQTLDPDWDACRDMAARRPPDLFVLVHHFGRAGEGEAARAFCDEFGALLLEDATHVMRPTATIGRQGDIVAYSPRKFLPVPDGGFLVVRGAALARSLEQVMRALPPDRAAVGRWVMKRWRRAVKQRVLPKPKPRGPLPATTMDEDGPIPEPLAQLWMSGYSRWRLGHSIRSGEIDRLARRRVDVHRTLATRLAKETAMREIAPGDAAVPIATMMRCENEATAARMLNELRAIGARVYPWLTLPPEVKADPIRHREALRLRRTLLCFTHEFNPDGIPTDFLKSLPPAAQ